MEVKYIVYVTVNLCNGKLYFGVHKTNPEVFDGYIGCGIYRPNQACKDFPFHKAVKKYGYENFRRTIIRVFPDTDEGKEQAYKLESEIVTETLLKSKYVYNVSKGGQGGDINTTYKTVYQYSLDGNFLRSFKTAHEAALVIDPENCDNATKGIRHCCLGNSYGYKGYYWSYFKDFLCKESYCQTLSRRYRKIAQYSLEGKFLTYYNNIQEARVASGIRNIHYAIKNESSLGGFQWRWYTGDTSDIAPFESLVTQYRCKPIIMTTTAGTEIEFESIKQCIQQYPKFSSHGIKNVIRGIHKTHKGYMFRWKDDDIV